MISFSALVEIFQQRSLKELATKGFRLWRRSGWRGIRRWLQSWWFYRVWVQRYDTLNEKDMLAIRGQIEKLRVKPVISILMPTYNTPEEWLLRSIDSVRAQLYPNWELCIADDASSQPHVRMILEKLASEDDRIKVVFRKRNGQISAASNTCLEMASGEFVALLDHDDELPEHALYMVALAVNENPNLDLIYSDEDKIDKTGKRFGAYFKPDWNPDLLTAQNYISHLGVYRREILTKIGGFREGYEGSQDWDLAMRVSEIVSADHIHHIPHVLYHWRAIEGSTAISIEEKPYAADASIKVVQSHLERQGYRGKVSFATPVHLRTQYALPEPHPFVSVIVVAREESENLKRCIDSLISMTSYTSYEIIVSGGQFEQNTIDILSDNNNVQGGITYLPKQELLTLPGIFNSAVDASRGSILCFLGADLEVISEGWLEEMTSQAAREDIGVVGGKLYSPNGNIRHAGFVLGVGAVAGDAYSDEPEGITGYMGRAVLVQNVSAVTGECMALRKSVYTEVGGMDQEHFSSGFYDVDFCLRVIERKYRNLWTPFVKCIYHDQDRRKIRKRPVENREKDYMYSRWNNFIERDPAYNPNLTLDFCWPELAPVPRVVKPW